MSDNKIVTQKTPASLAVGGTKSSLHNRVARGSALNAKDRLCLLLDCSGSMSGYGDEASPIALLKRSVEAFVQTCGPDTALAMITFPEQHSVPMTLTKALVLLESASLEASGGTPMSTALQAALNQNPTRCVIISDGQPDSVSSVISQAEGYAKREPKIVCDTVHIGSSTHGEDCLKRVAEITGGVYIKFEDVSKLVGGLKYLTPSYRALLTSGNVDARELGAREVNK